MKRSIVYLLLIFAFVLTAHSHAIAQKAIVKANVAGLLSNQYGGAAEIVVGKQLTVGAAVGYKNRNRDFGFGDATTNEKGIVLIPEVRYYIGNNFEKAPRGIYIGGNYTYERLDVVIDGGPTDTLNTFSTTGQVVNSGIGVVAGYQLILLDRISLDFNISPYYNAANITGDLEAKPEEFYPTDTGFKLNRIGILIGVAF